MDVVRWTERCEGAGGLTFKGLLRLVPRLAMTGFRLYSLRGSPTGATACPP